jgi:hypothetical protein
MSNALVCQDVDGATGVVRTAVGTIGRASRYSEREKRKKTK